MAVNNALLKWENKDFYVFSLVCVSPVENGVEDILLWHVIVSDAWNKVATIFNICNFKEINALIN